MEDEEMEFTLLNKRDVLVYQIPPSTSSAGHKADDWKKCIWRGRMLVCGKGTDMIIKLIDTSSDKLFAQCNIPEGNHEKYVERAVDSSRYFVLKITNGNRHAFIGLGFEDRNDAFDLNVTLSDFKSTWVDRDKQVEMLPSQQGPARDFSLKEGEKITVNLKSIGVGGGRREEARKAEERGGGGAVGLLPPPPPSGPPRRGPPGPGPGPGAVGGQVLDFEPLGGPLAPPPSQPSACSGPGLRLDDLFGDMDDFQSASSAPVAADSKAVPSVAGQQRLPPSAVSSAASLPASFFDPFAAPVQGSAPRTAFPAAPGVFYAQPAGASSPLDDLELFK